MIYTVIDLETTGFSPSRGDRILELGAIKMQEEGQVIDKYSTLINPGRHISNAHVHGIEPELVKSAPEFHAVKGFLKSFLEGTTLVAHNASFDFGFLESELLDQKGEINGVCTIELSRLVDTNLPSRKLEFLCEYYGIETGPAHQALSDALATADLFTLLKTEYSNKYGREKFRRKFENPVTPALAEKSGFKRIEFTRSEALQLVREEKNKLQKLIHQLPAKPASENINSAPYLETLFDILSDRIISTADLKKLELLIKEFNLVREDVLKLHKQYLADVIKTYQQDGKISEFEADDLKKITRLLGLTINDLEYLIDESRDDMSVSFENFDAERIIEGKAICFTGELRARINGRRVDRSKAKNIARQKGMVIKRNVTKRLDYLVAANPNSMSGKSKKARKYGKTVLAEPEFWRLLGINVE